MKQSQFEKEYQSKADKFLKHRMKVVELAMKTLPSDELNEFLEVNGEMFNSALTGVLYELDKQLKGVDFV